MKKRLFLWVLSLLTVLCLLPAVAHAATVDSGKCGDNVTWTLDDAGTLTISGSGAMKDYDKNSSPWYEVKDSIKAIVVKDGVTSIGRYAFYNCYTAKSVTMGQQVASINYRAFGYCTGLKSIAFPANLKTIGEQAFLECYNLETVTMGDKVTLIDDYAFEHCSSLTSIQLSKNLTEIGWGAFSGCLKVKYLDLPASVTTVENYGLPRRLTTLNINNLAAWCAFDDGASDMSYLETLYIKGVETTDVVIPYGATSIIGSAFRNCKVLTSVSIPSSVKTIGRTSFNNCTALTAVTFSDGIESIGDEAFYGCTALREVVLPNSITSVGSYAFSRCSNLQAVAFSAGCTQISSSTFSICSNLQLVIIPGSIKTIKDYAFADCWDLAEVYYLGDVEDLDSIQIGRDNDQLLYANWYLAMIASKSPVDATTSVGGKSVTFTAEASHPKAKYQWLYLAPGSDEWAEVTDLSGRTSKKLTVPAKAKYDGYQFACYMYQDTGDYGIREAVSDPATMTVVPGPNYAYKLNNTMAAKGKTATLTVEGTGTGITYTWYYAEPGSSTYNKSSVTGNTYSLTMNDERDGRRVYCKITDKYGASVTTNVVTLRMGKLDVPAITLANKAETGKPSLTWKAAEGAAKYEVWRAESKNGPYTKMYTTTGTAYSNTTAEVGKTYYYKVRSINADGYVSSFCTVKSITCDLPAPVITLTNKAESGKPSLTWKAVDGAIKYEVYRATSKSGTYTKMYTTTGLSYVNTTAEVGKTYYYKVRAISDNQYATSGYSTVKSITCDLPAPVTSLYNSSASGKPTLTWKAVDGAIKYEVYRATSKNGSYSKMYTTTGLSYTNTTAEVGKTYYYKVRAISDNTYATSGYSTIKSITCDLPAPVVSITLNSAGQPKLTWKAVDGAVKYEVYRATSSGGTYTKMLTTTNLSYTNTSAAEGTTYYYKVRAIAENSYANSAYSTVKSITAK